MAILFPNPLPLVQFPGALPFGRELPTDGNMYIFALMELCSQPQQRLRSGFVSKLQRHRDSDTDGSWITSPSPMWVTFPALGSTET